MKADTLLNKSGLRVTRQRALILKILKKAKGHMDAIDIYRQVSKKMPRISLATVYRNLSTMKELGLINEVYYDDSHRHYELHSTGEHYHILCLGCGRVVEFKYPLVRYIEKEVAECSEFEISEMGLKIAGYCADCKKKGGINARE